MSSKSGERVVLPLDHLKIKPGFHEGMMIPECYEPLSEHLPKVKAMTLRDDDVMLCSFPKSGTHWMYRVLDMVIRGQVDYDVRTADSTFMDVQVIEKMADLDSPRTLVTHLPFNFLPSQVKDKRTKIVHVYRNPKAVAVSLYFQMSSIKPREGLNEGTHKEMSKDLPTAMDDFLSGKVPYGGWFNYLDTVTEFQKANPDHPIFNVSYEEMSQQPLETVIRLAKFLELSRTDEFCGQVVEACSFKKQKETEEKDTSQARMKFFRKGDMNDWKNHLTVALNERFDSRIKERASRCPFSAKYVT